MIKSNIAAVLLGSLLATSCAGTNRSAAAIDAAELAVREARVSEALSRAPMGLAEAERRLAAARAAREEGDETRARRLAEEASVYAKLAESQAEYKAASEAANY